MMPTENIETHDMSKYDLQRIDKLVAEHVMELKPKRSKLPQYSKSIKAAWQVLDAIEYDWKIEPDLVEFVEPAEQDDGPVWHEATYHRHYLDENEEIPLAICIAALKSKGVPIPLVSR